MSIISNYFPEIGYMGYALIVISLLLYPYTYIPLPIPLYLYPYTYTLPGRKIEWQDLTRIVRLIISDLTRSDEKTYGKSLFLQSYIRSY